MIGGGVPHELGIAQRRGAEHDTVDAERQPLFDRGAVADAAAQLDPQIDRAADLCHRPAIPRAAGKGGVEIDDVQPVEAGVREVPGLRRGIPVEDRGARHIAADEAHAGAVLEVDRRKQDHGAAGSASRSL